MWRAWGMPCWGSQVTRKAIGGAGRAESIIRLDCGLARKDYLARACPVAVTARARSIVGETCHCPSVSRSPPQPRSYPGLHHWRTIPMREPPRRWRRGKIAWRWSRWATFRDIAGRPLPVTPRHDHQSIRFPGYRFEVSSSIREPQHGFLHQVTLGGRYDRPDRGLPVSGIPDPVKRRRQLIQSIAGRTFRMVDRGYRHRSSCPIENELLVFHGERYPSTRALRIAR